MEFKCLWSAEPVSECPPVKELNRLRAEVQRLEEENRWLEEENRKLRERIPLSPPAGALPPEGEAGGASPSPTRETEGTA